MKKMKKDSKKLMLILICLAMLFSLVACGSPGNSDVSNNNNPATTDSDEPVVVTVATYRPLEHFDKHNGTGGGVAEEADYLWGDNLIDTDWQNNYWGTLATSWELAEDGLSCTFHLRDDVYFHNGEKFTSADVKFSLERLVKEDLSNASLWYVIDQVDTPDEQTAILYFTEPMPLFMSVICSVPMINEKAYNETENFWYNPVGTGAFKVASFDPQLNKAVFEKNEDWWGWTDENRTNVDQIIFSYIPDETTRTASLRAGEVVFAGNLPSDDTTLNTLTSEGFQINEVNLDRHAFLILNCNIEPFSDPNFRKALSMCIDRQTLVDAILGAGDPANWPTPKHDIGWSEDGEYVYDPAQAKALVEASSYDGRELTFTLTTSRLARAAEIAQAIQSMAKEVGINISINQLDEASWKSARASGEYEIFLNDFSYNAGDTYKAFMELQLQDKWKTGYYNEEVHNIAQECQTLVDLEKRDELQRQAYQIIMDEPGPYLHLYAPAAVYAYAGNITGLETYVCGNTLFRYINVTE